ncbi:hypothetical protein ACFV0B_27895 [Streptomyces xanthophaeus]|uniref:hypothetical protein n=1 Tax=Streptomyces xanthophaeus TaxID=67385 RepID=UPI00368C0696
MKMKHAGGVLAASLAAMVLPVVVASPASAAQGDCQLYLFDRGYNVGPKVESACRKGANYSNVARWMYCYWDLTAIGVKEVDAAGACNAA